MSLSSLFAPDAIRTDSSDPIHSYGNSMAGIMPPDFALTSTASANLSTSDYLSKIKTILQNSPTGRTAVHHFDAMNSGFYKKDGKCLGIEIAPGLPSEYSAPKITLDGNEAIEEMALTFVHEVNHAWYDFMGKTAEAKGMKKQDYIDKCIYEEAEGAWLAIEAKLELKGSEHDNEKLTHPQDERYLQEYDRVFVEEKKKGKDERTADENARRAARAFILKGFHDGVVGCDDGSGNIVSYTQYYGDIWLSENHP